MKDNSYKKYIYIGTCLFAVIALAIILFFLLLRIDVIGNMFFKVISVLMPFIIGGVIAYIIAPLCNRFEKGYLKLLSKMKNDKRKESLALNLSVFSGIIVLCLFIYLLIMVIVPQLITSVVSLIQILPESTDKLVEWTKKMLASNPILSDYLNRFIDKAYEFIQNWLSNGLLEFLQNVASGVSTGVMSVFTMVMDFIIGFIVAIYILLSRKKLLHQIKLVIYSIFKKNIADIVKDELKFIDKVFSGFINGKIVDSVIVAFICYVGMMIFRIFSPSSTLMSEMLISVIVGIFNIIPFFGWYIGLILAALFTLMVNPLQCVVFVIFDIVLMQIDGNVISPKIIGNSTGLSSFWVLFSILFFGGMFGFIGMLLGVPIFAVIYDFIKKRIFRGLQKKGRTDMAEKYEREYMSK